MCVGVGGEGEGTSLALRRPITRTHAATHTVLWMSTPVPFRLPSPSPLTFPTPPPVQTHTRIVGASCACALRERRGPKVRGVRHFQDPQPYP